MFFSNEDGLQHLLGPLIDRSEKVSPFRFLFQSKNVKAEHIDALVHKINTCKAPAVRIMVKRIFLLFCALTVDRVYEYAFQTATAAGYLALERFHSTLAATSEVFFRITCTEVGQTEPLSMHFLHIFDSYVLASRTQRVKPVEPPRVLEITQKQDERRHTIDLDLESSGDENENE